MCSPASCASCRNAPSCHAPLGTARADDAPPYFVILIIGHIVIPAMLLTQKLGNPTSLQLTAIFVPLTLVLALGLLRPVKGGVLAVLVTMGLLDSTRAPGMTAPPDARLARVVLDGEALTRLSPMLEADRAQAVADLAVDNRFAPVGRDGGDGRPGPYVLHLSIREGRLVFDIRRLDGATLMLLVGLALGPFRRLIKDYHLLVDSHIKAVEEGREARIQAIDMGRRGLHNEGATLMLRAARRQDRHRLRHRAPAVHPGLRAAPEDLRAGRMKVDGIAYRSVWVDPRDGWSVHILDQTKLPWALEILRLTDVGAGRRTRSAPCRCAARR